MCRPDTIRASCNIGQQGDTRNGLGSMLDTSSHKIREYLLNAVEAAIDEAFQVDVNNKRHKSTFVNEKLRCKQREEIDNKH